MTNHQIDVAFASVVTFLCTLLAVVLLWQVWGSDAGSATEVRLLQGTPASNAQCDAMYHAEYIARHTPAHRGIVQSIKRASCPW
jgi:hypothetical protein